MPVFDEFHWEWEWWLPKGKLEAIMNLLIMEEINDEGSDISSEKVIY